MSVLNFDKNSLSNLEYSLQREMLSTNRAGGYMSTTIVCCNTRKYHGLVVTPIDGTDEKSFVLLSSLDETVIQHGFQFNLAIHRFPGTYEPKGHKYIMDFNYTPTPTITYRVGGVLLRKELLWIHKSPQLLVRYTLLEATSPTTLRLRPFLAFRDKHSVSKANLYADGHSYPIRNGVKNRLYQEFPWIHMQTDSPQAEFVPAPEWYYNFEYLEEMARGYDFQEDLLTTGYFEAEITKDKPLIFSCSPVEVENTETLSAIFEKELKKRSDKKDFLSCLRHSARQFVVHNDLGTETVAGYPWFGRWGRDTFIALPGITLTQGNVETCREVIDTMTNQMQDGLFPNMGSAYNSVDAPLWFFWTLQQLEPHLEVDGIWKLYGEKMKDVLNAYRRGIGEYIAVHDNGLVWASHPHLAMTWMDAVVDGKPVTGRDGYQVEINALWYNAICYTLQLAEKAGDKKFVKEWKSMPQLVKESFLHEFWYEEEGYLADYCDPANGIRNVFVRCNQIIACSLDNKMLSEEQQLAVCETVATHLLTPRGLRTLTPRNKLYQGRYEGDQPTRDRQYHQGTVWVWPLEHYVKAMFDLHGADFVHEAENLLAGFDEDISDYGIGSVCEIYDGDPPHIQRGAPSQAWSVGAVLRINEMIEKYRKPAVKKRTAKAPAKSGNTAGAKLKPPASAKAGKAKK